MIEPSNRTLFEALEGEELRELHQVREHRAEFRTGQHLVAAIFKVKRCD